MRKHKTKKTLLRNGAALVEMAVCLPVFVLLVWGTIELNESIFTRQTLTSAAHEGTLLGTRPGTTEQEIRDRVDVILAARGITDYTVSVGGDGVSLEDLVVGELFSVTVRTNNGSNFLNLNSIGVQITGRKP